MADTSFWVSAALATIPLSGVIGGFVAQSLIAGRNLYISSITAERSRWIEKLRSNLAAFHAAVEALNFKSDVISSLPSSHTSLTDKDLFVEIERADGLAATLLLQLNPGGLIDGNVALLVKSLNRFRHVDSRHLNQLLALLIEHSQWLLKAEWEKVKWEAQSRLHRWWHRKAEAKRLADYRRWAAEDGSFGVTLAALTKASQKPSVSESGSSGN